MTELIQTRLYTDDDLLCDMNKRHSLLKYNSVYLPILHWRNMESDVKTQQITCAG